MNFYKIHIKHNKPNILYFNDKKFKCEYISLIIIYYNFID